MQIDHPSRHLLVAELHARPFPVLEVPSTALFLAFHRDEAVREGDRERLAQLTAHFGAPAPEPGVNWYQGPMGRATLKWESHTEFVTYAAFQPGIGERAFDPAEAEVFPPGLLEENGPSRICATLIRIEPEPEREAELTGKLESWFVNDSVAAARVLDGAAVVVSDFRIDPAGFMRFAVFVRPGTGKRRIGRIVQRVSEIETYRAMSMMGLVTAREMTPKLNALEARLVSLVDGLGAEGADAEAELHELLQISAELESLAVSASSRFRASRAYETIVNHRIEILREERVGGRQTFAEFMMRRYDPAMRTVESTDERLREMSERAQRAAELLHTQVDVAHSREYQALLASMDRRADLQLRLQRTVEGLSVVAISYYAVSLASLFLAPFGEAAGISSIVLKAGLVPVVLGFAWLALQQVRRRIH